MKTLSEMLFAAAVVLLSANACNRGEGSVEIIEKDDLTSRQEVARMLSSLPLAKSHLYEVYDAVCSSSDNGYDEEYIPLHLQRIGGEVGCSHTIEICKCM